MKGRILFALLFTLFIALGIISLGDMQLEAASLPAQSRLTVYVACAPAPDMPVSPTSAQAVEKDLPRTALSPVIVPCAYRAAEAPTLNQSYYLACYQAFHYSDRAG